MLSVVSTAAPSIPGLLGPSTAQSHCQEPHMDTLLRPLCSPAHSTSPITQRAPLTLLLQTPVPPLSHIRARCHLCPACYHPSHKLSPFVVHRQLLKNLLVHGIFLSNTGAKAVLHLQVQRIVWLRPGLRPLPAL